MANGPIYVDREGFESCLSTINSAIEDLQSAAAKIDGVMKSNFPECWKGSAADNANVTYEEQYKPLLTKQVPEGMNEFVKFLDNCKRTIIDIDNQLAGGK